METLRWMFVISGLLLTGLSIPLALRRIPPNGLYGFRVRATLEDPGLWYAVNAHFGCWLCACGVITVLGALLLSRLTLSLDDYALAMLGVFALPFALGVASSLALMKSHKRGD